MRGRGLVKVGTQAFDGRAGLGAQEIAKFGAGLIEEKRLGNLVTCLLDLAPTRGATTCSGTPCGCQVCGCQIGGWQVWGIGDHGFSPLFTRPGNLVRALWGAFLCDDDNCSYVGSKDICKVPEMVYGVVFEQVSAFFSSIGTGQEWIGKDQAQPAMGAHYLQP